MNETVGRWARLGRNSTAGQFLLMGLLAGAFTSACSNRPDPAMGRESITQALGDQSGAAVLPTTIHMDVGGGGRPIPREIFGNNIRWDSFDSYYASGNELPPGILNDLRALGVPSLRYPGGCGADGFTWETTIGPKGLRGEQLSTLKCTKDSVALAGKAHFGVDEFLQLAEKLGAEPQLTLQFRPLDKTFTVQAESSYTVLEDEGNPNIRVSDYDFDDGSHVDIHDPGDSIELSFNVPRAGYYRLHLRNRAGFLGQINNPTAYWTRDSYTYMLNPGELEKGKGAQFVPVSFTGDTNTLTDKAPDRDGHTVWGITRSPVLYLREGTRQLRITTNERGNYLMVDWLQVEELNHDNSVKRAMAWLAYVNGDPADTRSIGIDEAGIDWRTVGYWASLRGRSDHGNHPAPYGVKFWEVGNEAWGGDPFGVPQDAAGRTDHRGYAQAFLDYKNALSAIDPNLYLSASSTSFYSQGSTLTDWMSTLVQELGDDVRMIHFHPYYPWVVEDNKSPASHYQKGITAYVGLQTSLDWYRNKLQLHHPSRYGKLKLSASEWAAAYGWDNEKEDTEGNLLRSYAVRWTGVMTAADKLGTMSKNTDLLENAQYWMLWGGDTCVFQVEGGSYFKHGIFEVLQAFNHYWGDQHLPVSVSGSSSYYFPRHSEVMPEGYHPHLAAYGSLDAKRYYLMVLNKDEFNAKAATVQLSGLPSATNRVQVRTIRANAPAPTYSAIDSATADIITTSVTSLTPFAPSFDYTFPASSITLFVIDRAPEANPALLREVEDVATTVKDTGSPINLYDWAHDSGSHMALNEVGDEILVPFSVTERAYYVLELRHRSGTSDDTTSYWEKNAYTYTLDGTPMIFAGDRSTILSGADLDGYTVWGTSRSDAVLLEPGRHSLRIKMNATWGKVDWLRVRQDMTRVVEVESSHTVVTNASGEVKVIDLTLDSGKNLSLQPGDTVRIHFSVPRSGKYALSLRQRTGVGENATSQVPAYQYKLDTITIRGAVDTATLSKIDPYDGFTVWGTVNFPLTTLSAGSHTLEVTMTSQTTYGMLDYLIAVSQAP
ncbi:hypothetical protein JQX13_05730 [Archangium violaceum]|uniref:alpha-L-arabinofuranosidase C-terminal domain-containing protein n=1 Tax=Archangium violaceum TaxID=83451 RepID=UPI00193B6227|nr:alpha-L-arabinofuranosidase C-terminal domain-containing protein [Archangium violaceum]QRK09632.1 hypothetical protein JQX13_05730 [Archangium violaceum]